MLVLAQVAGEIEHPFGILETGSVDSPDVCDRHYYLKVNLLQHHHIFLDTDHPPIVVAQGPVNVCVEPYLIVEADLLQSKAMRPILILHANGNVPVPVEFEN